MPQTLHRAIKRQGAVGAPLPSVFSSFEQARILFRRSATSMIAGLPGNYKSTLVYNLICKWSREGETIVTSDGEKKKRDIVILYVAADSDQHQVGSLCAAMISGDPVSVTENGVKSGKYDEALASISSVEWEYKPLNVNQIANRMESVEQRWGKKPDLVVVDNLMNVVAGPGDWKGQIEMTRDLRTIAMTSQCHMMILHHTQEHPMKNDDVGWPPPRWDIHGKVNQFPTLILTVATAIPAGSETGILRIAPVKNRTGPDDLTGRTCMEFNIRPSTGRVWEIPERSFY